jgi:hypothetical protein
MHTMFESDHYYGTVNRAHHAMFHAVSASSQDDLAQKTVEKRLLPARINDPDRGASPDLS